MKTHFELDVQWGCEEDFPKVSMFSSRLSLGVLARRSRTGKEKKATSTPKGLSLALSKVDLILISVIRFLCE